MLTRASSSSETSIDGAMPYSATAPTAIARNRQSPQQQTQQQQLSDVCVMQDEPMATNLDARPSILHNRSLLARGATQSWHEGDTPSPDTQHKPQPPPPPPQQQQQQHYTARTPYSINVHITHDTKESEELLDVREVARLYSQQEAALRTLRGNMDYLTVPDWVRLHPQLGSYLAEMLGTFAWVLVVALTSMNNDSIFDNPNNNGDMTSIPIGFMLAAMVLCFSYISGAHLNPAISFTYFLLRQQTLGQCVAYMICQLAGALAAGLCAMLIQADSEIFVPSVQNSLVSTGLAAELVFTFALTIVVANVGDVAGFQGIAIGMAMTAGSASVAQLSGGAFNPAGATGLQLARCFSGSCEDLAHFWVYWVAPLSGAAIAALLYSQMYQPPPVLRMPFQDVDVEHVMVDHHHHGLEASSSSSSSSAASVVMKDTSAADVQEMQPSSAAVEPVVDVAHEEIHLQREERPRDEFV